ncbi:MAG: 50S ribosomal protein L9 [Campylobacterales bacterium]
MKVLLIKDVKSLGKAGEIKDVKQGYGQNFLIAKGFAKLATPEVIEQWEEDRKNEEARLKDEMEKLEGIKKQLEAISVKVSKKVGANGALFGAITKDEIAEALQKENSIEVDKKSIEIDNPLKATGVYEVDIKLGHGIHGKLKVDVVAEDV